MVTEQAIRLAQTTAKELRGRGEEARANAIEELVHAARHDRVPARDPQDNGTVVDLLGATGQMIKAWVQEGRISTYTVGGRLTIPKEIVEEYVRRSKTSLDLEDYSDAEAAALVAEERRKA